jgi:hypothetical protein
MYESFEEEEPEGLLLSTELLTKKHETKKNKKKNKKVSELEKRLLNRFFLIFYHFNHYW